MKDAESTEALWLKKDFHARSDARFLARRQAVTHLEEEPVANNDGDINRLTRVTGSTCFGRI
jgi:hypothetical protein